jgi:hypothetical protein
VQRKHSRRGGRSSSGHQDRAVSIASVSPAAQSKQQLSVSQRGAARCGAMEVIRRILIVYSDRQMQTHGHVS